MIRHVFWRRWRSGTRNEANDIETILSSGRGIGEDFNGFPMKRIIFRFTKSRAIFSRPLLEPLKMRRFLTELINVNCRQTPAFNGRMDLLKSELDSYVRRRFDVTIVCSSPEVKKTCGNF